MTNKILRTPIALSHEDACLSLDQYALLSWPIWFIVLLRCQFRQSHMLPVPTVLQVHFEHMLQLLCSPPSKRLRWVSRLLRKYISKQRQWAEGIVSAGVVRAEDWNKMVKDSTLLD